MNRSQTTLDIPEMVFTLTHPMLNGGIAADIDWTAQHRGSVTLAFCGVDLLLDDDVKTEASPAHCLCVSVAASDGEVTPRCMYCFKPRRIVVTHGLKDAAHPDRAPHGLMLKFNVRGNAPESDQQVPAGQRTVASNQLQPVLMISMTYPQLRDAEAASRNQTMVMATQHTAAGPRFYEERFDIVRCLQASSAENPNLHCLVHVGIQHSVQSLLCTPAAKELDRRYGMPFADIGNRLMTISKARVLQCKDFFAQITDKQSADNCSLTQMTLKIGTALGIEQQDWAQWAESIKIQGALTAEAHMPVLVAACLDVGHSMASEHRGPRVTSVVTPEHIAAALRSCDSQTVAARMQLAVTERIASEEKYAFDTHVNLEVPMLVSAHSGASNLTARPTVDKAGGESQNFGGLIAADTVIANRRQLMPALLATRASLCSLLGDCDASHTHPSYMDLSTAVRRAMREVDSNALKNSESENDCEDVASRTVFTYNAAKVLTLDHHAFVAADRLASDSTCTCRLHAALAVYAQAVPHDAEYMPCVEMMMGMMAQHRDLGVGLVFASGANRDLAGSVVAAPTTVGGEHGVFNVLERGLRAKVNCGHACAVDMLKFPLGVGDPMTAHLASMHAQGRCTRLRLSQVGPGLRFFEATGPSTQLPDTWDMANRVTVAFKPVADRALQLKLDAFCEHPMAAFKATNLIAALHTQSLLRMGLESTVQQKFTLNDASCFYQNIISEGDAVALTTGFDNNGSVLQVEPTAYVPLVLGSTAAPVTRMLLHAPCDDEEVTLLTMLWRARAAMNPTMQSIMADAALAGVSTPPMRLRGTHVLRQQTGEVSTVVICIFICICVYVYIYIYIYVYMCIYI